MPFKSKAQMQMMFAQHPRMAKRWAEHTPDMSGLPERVEDQRRLAANQGMMQAMMGKRKMRKRMGEM